MATVKGAELQMIVVFVAGASKFLYCFFNNNIHEKLLDSDWLRTVQFFLNTVQKRGN